MSFNTYINLSCNLKVISSYFSVDIFLEVSMAGALKGIRVIDLTSMISGPSATMILGDQDAEIIKIENTFTHQATNRRTGQAPNQHTENRL